MYMLNAKAFANAATIVVVAAFIICRIAAWIIPSFLFQVGQSWFHTIQMEPGQITGSLTFGALLLGLISAAIVTWLMAYSIITLYNKWAKE